jgi:arylsulfatase A-like enzyme
MEESPPNVVLVVMDTARTDVVETDTGTSTTPNIASLAEGGIAYPNTRAVAPWTLPSHASLFTGTYPSRHGAHASHKRLTDSLPTLAEYFSEEGYETVAASNNTWVSEEFGFARGFDRFFKSWQLVQSTVDTGQVARTTEGGRERVLALFDRLFEGNPIVNTVNALYGRYGRKRVDNGAARTNRWLDGWFDEREADRSFFLFVNYLEPHLEYRPPEAYAKRFLPDGIGYKEAMSVPQDAWGYLVGNIELSDDDFEILRALYRAEVAYLDKRIGDLLRSLKRMGEWEDTLFVVLGDHGENIGDHGLMDHQYCLYETLLRVPLVIGGGAAWEAEDRDRPVELVDIAPTLLDAAGVPFDDESVQGRSFHPSSNTEQSEQHFAEYLGPQPSMDALERRVGNLPDEVSDYDRQLRAVYYDGWKLIRGSDGSTELYDLTVNPNEIRDQSESEPERVEDLSILLDEWLASFDTAEVGTDDIGMSSAARNRLEDLGYLH